MRLEEVNIRWVEVQWPSLDHASSSFAVEYKDLRLLPPGTTVDPITGVVLRLGATSDPGTPEGASATAGAAGEAGAAGAISNSSSSSSCVAAVDPGAVPGTISAT